MSAEGDHQKPHKSETTVSTIHQCQSKDAKYLVINNIGYHKLGAMGIYDIDDIGGTSTDSKPDLWFFCTIKMSPARNITVSLFVCHRNVGTFKVSVSDSSELTPVKDDWGLHEFGTILGNCKQAVYSLPNSLTTKSCMSNKVNENHYLTTYYFTLECLQKLDQSRLLIPINIEMNPKNPLDLETVKQIKMAHDFKELLSRKDTDFVLKSTNGKEYPVHKIVLAAHSPMLLQLIKNAKSQDLSINISDNDMELFLQFIYTGTIDNMFKQDCMKLLEIATTFQIESLFDLTQFVLLEQISLKNALDIAGLAAKFNLEILKGAVFKFIANNREVLETEQWKNLEDVQLAKQLAHYLSQI